MNLSSKLEVILEGSLIVALIEGADPAYVEIKMHASLMALMTVKFFSADG
jgi:hypothetical protein